MGLPNLSYMMKVGQIRHIQAQYEIPGARNPDTLVRHLLTPRERFACAVRGRFLLGKLRANPFYYYVLARTRYYDALFEQAIADGHRFILNIGCGGDTRAYRWRDQLKKSDVIMVECDQRMAIEQKARLAHRRLQADHVQYMAIDLNDRSWPDLDQWLRRHAGHSGFVMLEGVSPYIDRSSFEAFLRMLADGLAPGSRMAYDYKLAGVADEFGRLDADMQPFRLGADATQSATFHASVGLAQVHHELGAALVDRLVPNAMRQGYPSFEEDALVQLMVAGPTTGRRVP